MGRKDSPLTVTDSAIKENHAVFSTSKQNLDDARMAHATLCKEIESLGIHRGALKLVHKLLKQDIAKAQDFMNSFERYSEVLGLYERLATQDDMLKDDEADQPADVQDYGPSDEAMIH